ncbi:hypothetical protein [Nocardioides zhouii]|uniref:DUF4232 domain-containing protein n=1 Tax=Nocardioides zhouii TaxID=1168729 RepID=A0A4Q2SNN6_9ACTN|nr:hypothetical protein [Nocardioides zhouii]RYC07305.1 hypothetical protein EUA94_14545 [Nocardioides zhouii]
MSDFTRRTVVRGAAWTVPVVAVATTVPAFAASNVPPPPVINFGGACGNTGAQQKGCGGDKTLQVPLTLSNPGPTDIIFQITAMFTCNCATAPTSATPGDGTAVGVRGIFATPNHTVPSQNDCTLVTPPSPACPGGIAGGNVLVPAGTSNATYWIESNSLGSSSTFSSRITFRLLAVGSCAVLRTGEAFTASAISPANCDG